MSENKKSLSASPQKKYYPEIELSSIRAVNDAKDDNLIENITDELIINVGPLKPLSKDEMERLLRVLGESPDLEEETSEQLPAQDDIGLSDNTAKLADILYHEVLDPQMNVNATILALDNRGIRSHTFRLFIDKIRERYITEIDLSNNFLDDDSAILLAEFLSNRQTIKKLNLSHNSIGSAGIRALAEILKTNTSLITLDISANHHLTFEDAQLLAEALVINDTLTTLILPDQALDLEFSKQIKAALKLNRLVVNQTPWERVPLTFCDKGIDDGAVEVLSKRLQQGYWKPSELDLSHNQITIKSITPISQCLSHSRNTITKLNLDGNYLTKESLAVLTDLTKDSAVRDDAILPIDRKPLEAITSPPMLSDTLTDIFCDIKSSSKKYDTEIEMIDLEEKPLIREALPSNIDMLDGKEPSNLPKDKINPEAFFEDAKQCGIPIPLCLAEYSYDMTPIERDPKAYSGENQFLKDIHRAQTAKIGILVMGEPIPFAEMQKAEALKESLREHGYQTPLFRQKESIENELFHVERTVLKDKENLPLLLYQRELELRRDAINAELLLYGQEFLDPMIEKGTSIFEFLNSRLTSNVTREYNYHHTQEFFSTQIFLLKDAIKLYRPEIQQEGTVQAKVIVNIENRDGLVVTSLARNFTARVSGEPTPVEKELFISPQKEEAGPLIVTRYKKVPGEKALEVTAYTNIPKIPALMYEAFCLNRLKKLQNYELYTRSEKGGKKPEIGEIVIEKVKKSGHAMLCYTVIDPNGDLHDDVEISPLEFDVSAFSDNPRTLKEALVNENHLPTILKITSEKGHTQIRTPQLPLKNMLYEKQTSTSTQTSSAFFSPKRNPSLLSESKIKPPESKAIAPKDISIQDFLTVVYEDMRTDLPQRTDFIFWLEKMAEIPSELEKVDQFLATEYMKKYINQKIGPLMAELKKICDRFNPIKEQSGDNSYIEDLNHKLLLLDRFLDDTKSHFLNGLTDNPRSLLSLFGIYKEFNIVNSEILTLSKLTMEDMEKGKYKAEEATNNFSLR
ncbi:MAG TPA: hypothetical protein VHE99_07185 [Gammaproteobacteria bacterium]|nr:hypothetical protein [Gammaproteobacteria bacterium]